MSKQAEVIDLVNDNSDTTAVRRFEFYVAGKPVPLPRPRFYRSGIWNPVSKAKDVFRTKIKAALLWSTSDVLFNEGETIQVTLWFYMKRPNADFVGGRRAPGNLRPHAEALPYASALPDIDNLTKFVLDALNKLVYVDDRQVVKLVAYKVKDNHGTCDGATRIIVQQYP